MRSAEWMSRGLLCVAVAALAGCSTMSEPIEKLKQATGMAPAAPSAAASAAAPGPSVAARIANAASAAVAVVKPEPEVVVTPAAQRAFDDARRAMVAGRHDEAERGFQALAKVTPELGGPHANLGILYRQAGKLPESVAELELATKASPNRAVYFNQLGISCRMAGQFAKAKEAYERAIALDPNYSAAILNLGILSDLYLGDRTRALELYGKYLALSPAGDALVTKWVADIKNRKPQAQAMLEKKE